jgi:Leucine-rich repeat (LRR) protein
MSELALERIRKAKKEHLTKLNLSYCGLTELPNELFELIWLEELILNSSERGEIDSSRDSFWRWFCNFFYLDKFVSPNKKIANNIKRLNPKIKELQALKKLEIFGADSLDDLSPLKDLYSLQKLWISGSQVKDLSPLKDLQGLQNLVAYRTKVSDLSPLKDLQNLNLIDFSGTQVSDLRPLKDLQNLNLIDFSGTQVSDLRPLKDLQNLNLIDFSGTQVSDLRPLKHLIEKGLSVCLKSKEYENAINVQGCPLSNPPKAIVEQGNAAILSYFRQIEEQGTVPLYEAKLIMVGEPGAGKTSLTEKLIDETHKVIPDDPNLTSTLGINIRENWIFPDCHRQTGDFTSHIWDFGGQEIQYMTHQFFLSPESLYVLVADDRKQHTLFPYWFEVIHLLGKDDGGRYSPIIVVLNERKHKSITNFDLVEYRRKYPDTQIDVLEVDLVDDNLDRFRAIRTKIQQSLCKLDHIGRLLPGKWSLIREEIRALNSTRNHISQTEFNEICHRFNIVREDDIQLIGKYLHRLGIILHFQGDIQLRDFIIINPKWALKAVYAVLENKDVEKRDGRFTDADLDNYWQDLSADEKSNILSLMKKDSFEICYPIGNSTYIAPQLLAQNRPNFEWDNTTSLKCQFFYRFMPKGIITRLIVRKHEYLANKQKEVWARGAIFRRFDCAILVTEEETERNGLIAIEVNGKGANKIRALDFIRNEIEDIHRTWFPQIKYDERAPCNCEYCLNSNQPNFFEWSKLSQRVEENRQTIECDNVRIKDVPVLPLLEGYTGKERIQSLKTSSKDK